MCVQVRKIYETMYPKVPGARYDIKSTSFLEEPSGKTTGFIECHLTDDIGHNNVKGVFIMEADGGKIRTGRLYMTPVQEGAGDIDAYVTKLSMPKS